jgi:hypothetical protein
MSECCLFFRVFESLLKAPKLRLRQEISYGCEARGHDGIVLFLLPLCLSLCLSGSSVPQPICVPLSVVHTYTILFIPLTAT